MKSNFINRMIASMVLFITCISVSAQWEKTGFPTSTPYAIFASSTGRIIVSDFSKDVDGGLYYSIDKGDTFEKLELDDHSYTAMLENDGYYFAFGADGYVLRTSDFANWEQINYSSIFPSGTKLGDTYAAAVYHNKLFCAPFGLTPIYSVDNGLMWKPTDDASMKTNPSDVNYIYVLQVYNDKLYAIDAVNGVFEYNENDNKWSKMGLLYMAGRSFVLNDKVYLGSGVYDSNNNCLFTSTDMKTFTPQTIPDGFKSSTMNTLWCDGNAIYIGSGGGLYYSTDYCNSWNDISDGFPVIIQNPYIRILGTPGFFAEYDGDIYITCFEVSGKGGVFKRKIPTAVGIELNKQDINNDVVVSNDKNTLSLSGNNNAMFSVYDVNGALVINQQGKSIDLSRLKGGVYIYKINAGERIITGKFVK
jgi:hypothetical protein